MATYTVLSHVRVPVDRGAVEQRIYDRLSVDFLVHHFARSAVWAKKLGKDPQLTPVRRSLKAPLINRGYVEGT